MLCVLAAVAFLLVTFGVAALGPVALLPLGLALLALHFVVPVGPALWRRDR
jgi:hypothetical protein